MSNYIEEFTSNLRNLKQNKTLQNHYGSGGASAEGNPGCQLVRVVEDVSSGGRTIYRVAVIDINDNDTGAYYKARTLTSGTAAVVGDVYVMMQDKIGRNILLSGGGSLEGELQAHLIRASD